LHTHNSDKFSHLNQLISPVLHPLWFAGPVRFNGVAFRFELFSLGGNAAGVFMVEFTFAFQSPPVRGNVFFAFGSILGGCTSRNSGKDAGGYRSAKAGVVLSGQHLTYLIDGDKPAFRYLLHDGINL